MDNIQQTIEKKSPTLQNPAELTSNHAPLPIGCTELDEEQQRWWDNFYRQGQERDRKSEEERHQRKQAEQAEKQPLKQPLSDARPTSPATLTNPMDLFRANLHRRHRPKTAKKLNLPATEIEKYLTVAYKQECIIRDMQPVMDTYTTATIANVSRWLSAESHTKGSLLLRGYVGVGKTTMLYAIRSLFAGFGLEGFPVHSAYDINDLSKDKDMFGKLKAMEFLAIDDLGQEPATIKDFGNERNPFEELISARYDRLKQTLISTNLVVVDGKDQIEERYGLRIADRLREMCNTYNYSPIQKSYRK